MVEKNETENKYITSKDLEEQTKIILEAVDFSLKKYSQETNARFDSVDTRFDGVINSVNIRFNNVDARLDELEYELKTDINNVQTLIDGYVKAQEDFKQEFVIMKEEVRQMK